ncbi:phosphoribosylanthranilate isomerase, partial [Paracoccus sp. (in: a-proteobacteria)]
MTQVKICGLREREHVRTAVEAGAHYLGFVFFAGSPRAVTPDQAAALADV